MDAEISKLTQKLLTKQGMKFKLNTKVTKGDDSGESVKINTEAAKGGKEEIVRQTSESRIPSHMLTGTA
jgi:pyruvate/2-oxoglutarate dehydrogenase complex dihydrolipoamide dehydrogenase (E3) component